MSIAELRRPALLLAAVAAAMLAGAYAFEHVGGLLPCELCWWQRYAWMATLPIALATFLVAAPRAGAVLVAGAALAALAGSAIAAFHVGVEMKWWQGTATCGASGGGAKTVEELARQLLATPVVRCDEVPWSLLGISMAGWNMLIAAAVGIAALAMLATALRGRAA
jgi:disulfide bond formation protein DsbB